MIPVENFHVLPAQDPTVETVLKPGEVVTHVELPAPAAGLKSRYRKVRARRSWDFALAGAALAIEMDGGKVANARVFLSGAAPVPWRSRPVEAAVTGRPLDSKTIQEAARAVVDGADALPKNTYKLDLFKGVIEEELAAIEQV